MLLRAGPIRISEASSLQSLRGAIDAAFIGLVLHASTPHEPSERALDIGTDLAPDAKHAVRCRRCIRLLEQAHGGVSEIYPRVTHHANPVQEISVERIAGHVGVGGLLDGESIAVVPADRVADDAGGRSTQHLYPITTVVLDDVRLRNRVPRGHHADVRGRTPEYEDPVLSTALNEVVDDARKAVLRDLEAGIRRVLDRVPVDHRRGPPIDRDAEGASNNGEAFNGDLAAKNLDRGLTWIRRLDRGLALSIERDVLELRLYQDVLLTDALHQKNVADFEAIQDRSYSASCIAIDGNCFSAEVQDRGEAEHKEQQEPTLRSHFAMAVGSLQDHRPRC